MITLPKADPHWTFRLRHSDGLSFRSTGALSDNRSEIDMAPQEAISIWVEEKWCV